jgi:hypothetical protein
MGDLSELEAAKEYVTGFLDSPEDIDDRAKVMAARDNHPKKRCCDNGKGCNPCFFEIRHRFKLVLETFEPPKPLFRRDMGMM